MDVSQYSNRMGWIFTRIRSSEFLRTPTRAMKSLFEKLETARDPAHWQKRKSLEEGPSSHEVVDRVIRSCRRTSKELDETERTTVPVRRATPAAHGLM